MILTLATFKITQSSWKRYHLIDHSFVNILLAFHSFPVTGHQFSISSWICPHQRLCSRL